MVVILMGKLVHDCVVVESRSLMFMLFLDCAAMASTTITLVHLLQRRYWVEQITPLPTTRI